MSVMKTSLTIIPICPRELLSHYKNLSRLVLCYKMNWATLFNLIYFHCLLPVTNYLITKLSVTYNFSACREYLTENCLSFPSAPRWVMTHKYRGSIVVLSISKSVEPNEEQKEMISGFQQGILCKY